MSRYSPVSVVWTAGLVALAAIAVSFAASLEPNGSSVAMAQQQATATATATPTAVPTRTVSWRASASSRLPRQLQLTQMSGERGAGGIIEEGLCKNVLVTDPEAEVWAVTPQDWLILNEPDPGGGSVKPVTIEAYPCGGQPSEGSFVALWSPDGDLLDLHPVTLENPESGEQVTAYVYDFPADSQEGLYILAIYTEDAEPYQREYFVRDYLASRFQGPRLSLHDPVTHRPRPVFGVGDVVEIQYSTRLPWVVGEEGWEEEVEVGLYQEIAPEDRTGFEIRRAVDAWTVQTDTSGSHTEMLPIPADAEPGRYLLAVASMANPPFESIEGSPLLDSYAQRYHFSQELLVSHHAHLYDAESPATADIIDALVLNDGAAAWLSYEVFLDAIDVAGLTDLLKSDEPYTVFVPTDWAFSQLPAELGETLMANEWILYDLLLHHITPGSVHLEDGATSTALDGMDLSFENNGDYRAVDGVPVSSSLEVANGVIYFVDDVLLPAY